MWLFGRRNKERKAREIVATAHLRENPMQAHSVREEYLYLSTRRCKCGGRLEAYDHILRYNNGQPIDVIPTNCTRCAGFYCFVFDISFFHHKDEDKIDRHAHSETLDVMDWAEHGYNCLHKSVHSSGVRQDQFLQDAIWSFEEMLNFYPANGKYPFPNAFFNHQAVDYSHLRERYPRRLIDEAVNAARTRLGS